MNNILEISWKRLFGKIHTTTGHKFLWHGNIRLKLGWETDLDKPMAHLSKREKKNHSTLDVWTIFHCMTLEIL